MCAFSGYAYCKEVLFRTFKKLEHVGPNELISLLNFNDHIHVHCTLSTSILTIPSQDTVPLLNCLQLPYVLLGETTTSYSKFNLSFKASIMSIQNPSYLPSL